MPDMLMPRLSDSMTEGTVVRWLHPPGTEVERGDDLVEIETDKATLTCESEATGTLEILAEEGTTLPIGTPIARVGSPDEAAPPATPAPPAPAPPASAPSSPPAPGPAGGGTRVIASPLARRLARERGVDLATIEGTGPGGRIIRKDIEAAAPSSPARGAEAPRAGEDGVPGGASGRGGIGGAERAVQPDSAGQGGVRGAVRVVQPGSAGRGGVRGVVRVVRPGPAERVVVRRMSESAAIPQFTLATDVDIAACKRVRGAATYNDLVIRAAALALREFPQLNAAYVGGVYELYERVNIGVAVDAGGALLVPTVFDADRLPLADLARTTKGLYARARTGAITPDELAGGTFTVSNLGMYGVTEFAALLFPPQAAILAVGEVRSGMRITLSCDHRIVYGARAARFLARVRALLERPEGVVS